MPAIPPLTVGSFVLEGALERGEKAALIDGPTGRGLGFAALERATGALAGALASRGLGRGEVACLYMPNLPEYALAFHGVNRAGAVNTTANPLYTAGELRHQLEDSAAHTLFTVLPFLDVAREAADGTGVEQIVLVGDDQKGGGLTNLDELLADGERPPELELDPAADLSVLPYSSGTTGLPKGVMLTHRNLVANLCQIDAVLPLEPDDVLIGVLPFFHIYGMTTIMNAALRAGATVVTMPRFDLEGFLELIERHRVTCAYVVPPIALALARHPAVGDHNLSSLRMIMSGAAPLGPELTTELAKRLEIPVIQGYGMTELSPVSHLCPLTRIKPGTIGPPLPGTEARIVDPATGREAPTGERGELWIRGPQVMSGYLGNEEATAETIDSDGWLHTGDVAVADEDGYFAIVDRLKELIKYKGFQVPPAELEAVLLSHPAVADCAVAGVPDEEVGELPKGFVVLADGADVTDGELLGFVAERVAPQKRLRLIERVEEIPKSPSGKILRRRLRDG